MFTTILSLLIATTLPVLRTPTELTYSQNITTQKIAVTWLSTQGAKKYTVKLMYGKTVLAKKTVKYTHAQFSDSLLMHGQTYTVRVRAKATRTSKASAWNKKAFTFTDLDNDNDAIIDTDDNDDDNDGILDSEDIFPLDNNNDGIPDSQDPTAQVATYIITIKNNSFVNGIKTIEIGDSIKWYNKDEGGHGVAATNGSTFISPPLEYNESYTYTFTTAGIYTYYDPTYPGVSAMTGTITVTN